MSNTYYNHTTFPAFRAAGSSAPMRSELDAITSGFALLPDALGVGQKGFNGGSWTGGTFTNCTFVAPTLGVATATSINKVAITAPATGATLTLADGSTHATVGAYTSTFTFTAATSVTFPTSGTLTTTSNKLSVFAATTSAELAGVISDETGSGALVFANSPTLVAPTLGAATATSINKVTITAPASAATITVADGKTFTASATLTLAGTDGKTLTVSNNLTLAGTDGSTLNVGGGGTLGTAAFTAATAYAPAAGSSSITTVGTITSGTWTGTAIAIANGGTGSTSAANARIALGVRGWDLVEVLSPSGVATLDLSAFSGTDDTYWVHVENWVPSVDAALMQGRVAIASSVVTDANYGYTNIISDQGAAAPSAALSGGGSTFMYLSGGVSNTAAEGGFGGDIYIMGVTNTTQYKAIKWDGTYHNTANGTSGIKGNGKYRGGTGALTSFRILSSSGTFSATVLVYRLRKS